MSAGTTFETQIGLPNSIEEKTARLTLEAFPEIPYTASSVYPYMCTFICVIHQYVTTLIDGDSLTTYCPL
jgi:hypothetical protein